MIAHNTTQRRFVTVEAVRAVKQDWQVQAGFTLAAITRYKQALATLNRGTSLAVFNSVRAAAKRAMKDEKRMRMQLGALRTLAINGVGI